MYYKQSISQFIKAVEPTKMRMTMSIEDLDSLRERMKKEKADRFTMTFNPTDIRATKNDDVKGVVAYINIWKTDGK